MAKVIRDYSRTKEAKAKTMTSRRDHYFKAHEERIYLSNIGRELLEENLLLARAYNEYRNYCSLEM